MKNYKVTATAFGAYPHGSVLPGWAVERAGSVEEMVARGVVAPTNDPVNVDLRVPEPKTLPDPAPAMIDELNRVRVEAERLAADNRTLVARRDALTADLAARDKHLGLMTAELERMRAAAAAAETRVAELELELEAATAPAV